MSGCSFIKDNGISFADWCQPYRRDIRSHSCFKTSFCVHCVFELDQNKHEKNCLISSLSLSSWWTLRDSNPWPLPRQGSALPTELSVRCFNILPLIPENCNPFLAKNIQNRTSRSGQFPDVFWFLTNKISFKREFDTWVNRIYKKSFI